eukprot:Rmarinus@m.29419
MGCIPHVVILLFFLFGSLWAEFVTTSSCDGDVILTESTGTFWSNDPSSVENYLPGMDCSWVIQPNVTGHFDLTLYFTSFNLEDSPSDYYLTMLLSMARIISEEMYRPHHLQASIEP